MESLAYIGMNSIGGVRHYDGRIERCNDRSLMSEHKKYGQMAIISLGTPHAPQHTACR